MARFTPGDSSIGPTFFSHSAVAVSTAFVLATFSGDSLGVPSGFSGSNLRFPSGLLGCLPIRSPFGSKFGGGGGFAGPSGPTFGSGSGRVFGVFGVTLGTGGRPFGGFLGSKSLPSRGSNGRPVFGLSGNFVSGSNLGGLS